MLVAGTVIWPKKISMHRSSGRMVYFVIFFISYFHRCVHKDVGIIIEMVGKVKQNVNAQN